MIIAGGIIDMNNVKVNIIVISYNAFKYLKTTIERIFKATKIRYYLTIVDNGSNEDIRTYLSNLQEQGTCEGIIICLNKTNIGAIEALNQAYSLSLKLNVDYICKCDNDIYMWDFWLTTLIDSMELDGDIGMMGALRVSKYTKSIDPAVDTRFVQSKIQGLPPKLEISRFFNDNISKNLNILLENNGGGIKVLTKIPSSIPGHCVLIKIKALKEIGFLADPRYHKYGTDDIDLCWEFLKHNYKIAVNNNVFVYHFRHKSLPEGSERQNILRTNNLIFYNKWIKEITALRKDINFSTYLNDKNNEDYDVIRYMIKNWR